MPFRQLHVAARFISPNAAHRPEALTAHLFVPLAQVLEDNKQWWKLLNRSGQAGYVPYNILDVVKLDELEQVCGQGLFNQ